MPALLLRDGAQADHTQAELHTLNALLTESFTKGAFITLVKNLLWV